MYSNKALKNTAVQHSLQAREGKRKGNQDIRYPSSSQSHQHVCQNQVYLWLVTWWHTNSPSDAVGNYLNPAKDKKLQRYIVTHCSMPPTVFGEGFGLLWIGGFSLRHCPVACYNINMEKQSINTKSTKKYQILTYLLIWDFFLRNCPASCWASLRHSNSNVICNLSACRKCFEGWY